MNVTRTNDYLISDRERVTGDSRYEFNSAEYLRNEEANRFYQFDETAKNEKSQQTVTVKWEILNEVVEASR